MTVDRPPLASDNPRHAVWIDDAEGIRRITADPPGAEELTIGGAVYRHTRETIRGQWIYTRVTP